MNRNIYDFLDARMEEIARELKDTNGEYASELERQEALMENLGSIIYREEGIFVGAEDCLDMQEYLDHQHTAAAILQRQIYRQGCLDCIVLLKRLGVLV